jgi:tellurite resistance protein
MTAKLFFERVVEEQGPLEGHAAEAILEVAYLTMCVDAQVDAAELRAFAHAAGTLLGRDQDPKQVLERVRGWLRDFAARIDAESAEERLAELARELPEQARRIAYQVACVIASADSEEDDREFEFDLTLIAALDLDQAVADELAAEVRG